MATIIPQYKVDSELLLCKYVTFRVSVSHHLSMSLPATFAHVPHKFANRAAVVTPRLEVISPLPTPDDDLPPPPHCLFVSRIREKSKQSGK
ncbi:MULTISPECIES: hypothetical protein [Burkholderiaceae]|uniref:hypothetical protein n=1 Tax=Burkholderiaceae TaxID=119060 RepID=UPI001591C3A8|nr:MULTISPECIES: hypothetical protein [Burkholderiaceae]